MRYFIGTNKDGKLTAKHVVSGETKDIDNILVKFEQKSPDVTFSEVDEDAFKQSEIQSEKDVEKTTWGAFKATNPSPSQAIAFIAKHLGLE